MADYSKQLTGTPKQRDSEKKTITVIFQEGAKPDVSFTGFWTGKLVKAARNSIARAYRVRRRHAGMKPQTEDTQKSDKVRNLKKGGTGDVKVKATTK